MSEPVGPEPARPDTDPTVRLCKRCKSAPAVYSQRYCAACRALRHELLSVQGRKGAAVKWSRPKPGEPLDWSLLELADRAGLTGESWRAGRVLLKVSDAVPLAPDELALFQQHTGREHAPASPPREIWEAAGRRSGKSFRAALKGVHAACCRRYAVAAGERPTVLILAADREQAAVSFRYVRGIIDSLPELKALVSRRRKDQLELATGVDIHVATSDYKLVRGRTCCAAICDELAFWKSDTSASPDVEVLSALRPSLATIASAQLICCSTVYARSGALYAAFESYWAQDDPHVLFWRAPTRDMNPNIPQELVDRDLVEDPERARAEWLAEWRADVSSVFALDAVRAVVVPGRRELSPVAGVTYHAFCDPSGGSQDAMTLALAHVERGVAVLDLVRERKPKFDPATVVHEFAETLRAYGIGQLVGDRYGGVWVEQAFRERGIEYVASADSKSELYVRLVPLVNTGKVALLDQPTIVAQACGLERRVGRGTGQEVVDHGVHAHDDVINAVAGALVLASGGSAADTWVRFAAEYYGSRGERTAPAPAATRTVLSQEPTPQRCGCGAVFNAADRVTACPSCGVPVGTAAPAAHLPDLFPEAPVAAAPARRLGSCSRCGTLVDYTPSADGSPVRCPSCGLQP